MQSDVSDLVEGAKSAESEEGILIDPVVLKTKDSMVNKEPLGWQPPSTFLFFVIA